MERKYFSEFLSTWKMLVILAIRMKIVYFEIEEEEVKFDLKFII